MFKRCNISEDLIKRFTKVQAQDVDGESLIKKGDKGSSSPTGKKLELEKILLSVPLDADVASFSDSNIEKQSSYIPLYSERSEHDVTVCLPSAGYRSDSEESKRRIRTSLTPESSYHPKNIGVRRSRSLNSGTVTDRICEIREKFITLKQNQNANSKLNSASNRSKSVVSEDNPQCEINDLNKSINKPTVSRSRSFNTLTTARQRLELIDKNNNLTRVYSSRKDKSAAEKLRAHFSKQLEKTSKKEAENDIPQTIKVVNSQKNKLASNSPNTLRSSSFNTLQDAWENRKSKESTDAITEIASTTTDIATRRREKRRAKKASSLRISSEKSDSETEGDDGNFLTEAALKRLERRSQTAARFQKANRKRDQFNDENNNDLATRFETSSDKTLDSGIFDLAISNLSEDINKLSKRYDSNEFLIDDCLSPKSGYSSATESLAESLAESSNTFFSEDDDNMENRKKRVTKNKAKNGIELKTAVINNATKNCQQEKPQNDVTTKAVTSPTKTIGHQNCCKPYLNRNTSTSQSTLSRVHNSSQICVTQDENKKTLGKTHSKTSPRNGSSLSLKKETSQENSAFEKRIESSSVDLKTDTDKSNTESNRPTKVKRNRQKFQSMDNLSGKKKLEKKDINISDSNINVLSSEQQDLKTQLKSNQDTFKKAAQSKRVIQADNMSSKYQQQHEKPSDEKKVQPFIKKEESIKPKLAQTVKSPSLRNKEYESMKIDEIKVAQNEVKGKASKKIINGDLNNNKYGKEDATNKDNDSVASLHTVGGKPKYLVDAKRSTTSNKVRTYTRGDSIELKISLDPNAAITVPNKKGVPPKLTSSTKSTDTSTNKEIFPAKSQTISPKNSKTNISQTKDKIKTELENLTTTERKQDRRKTLTSDTKGIQCLLLNDKTKPGHILTVPNTTNQIVISEDIANDLGKDILENIEFKLPDYLSVDEEMTGVDCVDSGEPKNLDPLKLRMENVRLQSLLLEVEKARAGSIRALLHVNTLLNKVQSENTRLEGEIKECNLEKDKLNENLKEIQEQGDGSTKGDLGLPGNNKRDTVDKNLSIIVQTWKNEKKELQGKLNKSRAKEEESEKVASRLRVQYKKVKEQLEHSNNAFTMTLKNNLDATKRMEEELKNSLEEKEELLLKLNEGKKQSRELDILKQEMDELETAHVDLQDEKEQLEQKVRHLEKQKKSLLFEQEELHEQIGHSQEIIDKLTEAEEELREQLDGEIREKEYLQECLDETGQILYQLKNNEQRLLEDKDTLLDDLENELQEKETLQTTLSETRSEHMKIVDRLQQMNNIHITVKESLQQANKKEKNYQEEIEILTKTNHILHYTLEKEKEEKLDLQEMFDVIEHDHKKFKSEQVGKTRDLDKKVEELLEENNKLKELKETLEKQTKDLQESLEHEEENSTKLNQQLTRLKNLNETIDRELTTLRESGNSMEQSISDLRKQYYDVELEMKNEKKKNEKLTCSIEETEDMLEKVQKELTEAKKRLNEHQHDNEDLNGKIRDRSKRIRELESTLAETSEQRDKYYNRMTFYEKETKDLRKNVNQQTEQIGNLQLEIQRTARERDAHKRNCEMAVRDFEAHKNVCTENLKRLKEEISDLSNKIVEKERLNMKQKEQYQDQIDNTQSDLELFKSMLDAEFHKRRCTASEASDISISDTSIDINILKQSHNKFRDEFKSHVNTLESMLKESKEPSDTITVVQSPMSKIKLEELKQIRTEVFEVNNELSNLKHKFKITTSELSKLTLNGLSTTLKKYNREDNDDKSSEIDHELSVLNNLICRIEKRHRAVMSQNAKLLQRTLTDGDRTAKDLVKKFQVVSLEGENRQLKTLLGILKKKYEFDELEIADELRKADVSNTLDIPRSTNCKSDISEEESKSDTPTSPVKTSTPDSNLRYNGGRSSSRRSKNYSFFNEMMTNPESSAPKKYSRDIYTKSSGVSSYSSDEDDFTPPTRLPRRYNSLQSRSRRPRT